MKTKFLLLSILLFIQLDSYSQGNYKMGKDTINRTFGTITDDGGPDTNYLPGVTSTTLLYPYCADTITLSFTKFNSEIGHDSLCVYEGNSTAGTLLLHHSGNTIPPPVQTTAGALFLVWVSDSLVNDSGFVAEWRSENFACFPSSVNMCCGVGIMYAQIYDMSAYYLNIINPFDSYGYYDFSCTDTCTLRPNTNYMCNITTGFSYEERVKGWIDFNDDKSFDSITELFYDSTGLINHGGTVNFDSTNIPQSIYGKKVMMRLMSDYSANPEPMPCSNLQFGYILDLMVGIERYLPVNVVDISNEIYSDFHVFTYDNLVDIEYNLITKSKTSICIYDITGKVIYSIENNVQSAGFQHQSVFIRENGFYFVELISDGYTSIKKIIMN